MCARGDGKRDTPPSCRLTREMHRLPLREIARYLDGPRRGGVESQHALPLCSSAHFEYRNTRNGHRSFYRRGLRQLARAEAQRERHESTARVALREIDWIIPRARDNSDAR